MKKNYLLITLVISLFTWNGLSAQQQTSHTSAEQAQLESIKQSYLDRGIPEEWAEKRANAIFKSTRTVQPRSLVRNTTPVPGSIWIDRDPSGANYNDYHNYTPEEFVKKVFVKDADLFGSEIDDIIKNVKFIGVGWNDTTEVWRPGIDDRSLHYFDHGDVTSTVKSYDGVTEVPRFGIANGLLLSTGGGLLAEGENDYTNSFLHGGIRTTTFSNWIDPPGTYPPDPDLQNQVKQLDPLHEVGTQTILEFDFKPFVDSVSFQYVFASIEYKQFSNTPFNDAFGFFVSGPGLEDEWGNTGPTINIARYPNGDPISVNTSNWGFRENWFNQFIEYDPLGPTPAKTTGYGLGMWGEDSCATNPQWHVPVYTSGYTKRSGIPSYQNCDTLSMQYNGHSIVQTAKIKLKKGQWYHIKLAIGNINDDWYGSGAFLMAGSFDLGAPESNIPRPYTYTAYDSIYGWNSLYTGCSNTLELEFPSSTLKQNIYVWSEGSGANYVFDVDSGKFFNDSINYTIPANDSTLVINFKVDENVKNGSQVLFYSKLGFSSKKDTTEVLDLYAKSKTEIQKYYKPTANYAGTLDILTTNGSPYIQRSLDGGLTWEFARNTVTGEMKPYSKSQIANLASEENAYIIFREPNTCCDNDTLFISKNSGEPGIKRIVTMPVISGAIVDKEPGEHTVNSTDNFTFTITPTGNNTSLQPVITTSRTSIPDSEGIIIVKNENDSYTVTIFEIQESIEIHVDFVTSNMAIENNKIWADGSMLYMQTNQAKQAQIYTIAGALVQTVNLTSVGTSSISLSKGFYIVVVDNFTYKVIIK